MQVACITRRPAEFRAMDDFSICLKQLVIDAATKNDNLCLVGKCRLSGYKVMVYFGKKDAKEIVSKVTKILKSSYGMPVQAFHWKLEISKEKFNSTHIIKTYNRNHD